MKTFTQEHKNNLSLATTKSWQDETYRALLVQKQKANGYRCYPTQNT